jgi:hypothetical protein
MKLEQFFPPRESCCHTGTPWFIRLFYSIQIQILIAQVIVEQCDHHVPIASSAITSLESHTATPLPLFII